MFSPHFVRVVRALCIGWGVLWCAASLVAITDANPIMYLDSRGAAEAEDIAAAVERYGLVAVELGQMSTITETILAGFFAMASFGSFALLALFELVLRSERIARMHEADEVHQRAMLRLMLERD